METKQIDYEKIIDNTIEHYNHNADSNVVTKKELKKYTKAILLEALDIILEDVADNATTIDVSGNPYHTRYEIDKSSILFRKQVLIQKLNLDK